MEFFEKSIEKWKSKIFFFKFLTSVMKSTEPVEKCKNYVTICFHFQYWCHDFDFWGHDELVTSKYRLHFHSRLKISFLDVINSSIDVKILFFNVIYSWRHNFIFIFNYDIKILFWCLILTYKLRFFISSSWRRNVVYYFIVDVKF